MSYSDVFPDLAEVYLEDSWVLAVAADSSGATFRIDLVLTRRHPCYTAPIAGEQHCYRTGWLSVVGDTAADLQLSGAAPTLDPDGTEDLGNIDTFEPQTGDWWELTGEWGTLRVHQPSVHVDFTSHPRT